jgi:DNA-binding transcriptional MerR regulator
MKTGELATRFKLDPKTVKAWTDEFEEFFSDDAKGIGRTQRFYYPEDQIVLNTIRVARAERRKAEEIRAMLAAGERDGSLPMEFAIIKGDKAANFLTEVRILQLQIENLTSEIERLQKEKESNQAVFEIDRQRYEAKIDTLNQEVGKWRALYNDLKERTEKDGE